MKRADWFATGWRCKTGRAIEFSLFLPAGVNARVFRSGKSWRYVEGKFFWSKTDQSRRFKTKVAAMKACENVVRTNLRAALRILEAHR